MVEEAARLLVRVGCTEGHASALARLKAACPERKMVVEVGNFDEAVLA